jgi:hypothetical protein
VVQAATTVTLKTSASSATYGNPITFTATVKPVSSGGGVPDGDVTFKDGAAVLGTVTLANGVAALTIAGLTGGNHSITAAYSGGANYLASTSAALSQDVSRIATTVTVDTSATTAVYGQTVTFTATVAAGYGVPTGTVTFKDGTDVLGTVQLDASGVAVFTTSTLSVRTHYLTANYDGDVSDKTATRAFKVTVTNAATVTTLATSVDSAVTGQPVTLTATVLSSEVGVTSGVVTFKRGTTTLGTAPLDASGHASLTLDSLPIGTSSLTASYGGATGYTSSKSAAKSLVVAKAGTSSALSAAGAINAGDLLTVTVAVSALAPGTGTPGGKVTIKDGTTILGSGSLAGGVFVFNTRALSRGTHHLTAVYAGSSLYLGSTTDVWDVVVS